MPGVTISLAWCPDLASADVISMYLSVRGNTEMLPAILAAADSRYRASSSGGSGGGSGGDAGARVRRRPLRVATFSFEIPGYQPAAKAIVDGIPIYLYTFGGSGRESS